MDTIFSLAYANNWRLSFLRLTNKQKHHTNAHTSLLNVTYYGRSVYISYLDYLINSLNDRGWWVCHVWKIFELHPINMPSLTIAELENIVISIQSMCGSFLKNFNAIAQFVLHIGRINNWKKFVLETSRTFLGILFVCFYGYFFGYYEFASTN